jgi:hypothetical protein
VSVSQAIPGSEPPFDDSRRLTGANPYFVGCGAAMEALGPRAQDPEALRTWRMCVNAMRVLLCWPPAEAQARSHASGATLAFSAPVDQLFAATELNEWAWCVAAGYGGFHAPGHPAAFDEVRALDTLRRFASAEARPDVIALLDAAAGRDVPTLLDDDALTVGLGARGITYPLDALPASPDALPWSTLGVIPAALVTGSNGKTTTVRLIAAMLRAHGLRTAHSCTDGLFVGDTAQIERLEAGDYSGPAGARLLLRRNDVEAAVLETARGGLLRRGLALAKADVAVVTNISEDHFGEYGVQ